MIYASRNRICVDELAINLSTGTQNVWEGAKTFSGSLSLRITWRTSKLLEATLRQLLRSLLASLLQFGIQTLEFSYCRHATICVAATL